MKQTKERTRDFLFLYQEARSHEDRGGMGKEMRLLLIETINDSMCNWHVYFWLSTMHSMKRDMGFKIRLGYRNK